MISPTVIRPSSTPFALTAGRVTTCASCISFHAFFKEMLRSTPLVARISISFTWSYALYQLRSLYVEVVQYILGLLVDMTGMACYILFSGDFDFKSCVADCGTDGIGIRISYDRLRWSVFSLSSDIMSSSLLVFIRISFAIFTKNCFHAKYNYRFLHYVLQFVHSLFIIYSQLSPILKTS